MISIRLRSVGASRAHSSPRRSSESSGGAAGTTATYTGSSGRLPLACGGFRAARRRGMGGAAMGVRLTLLACAAAGGLAGCGGQSTLSPHSHQAHEIRTLWWWLLAVASVVFLGAVAMLVVGWVRRSREGLPLLGNAEQATTSLVVIFGMVGPIVVLSA